GGQAGRQAGRIARQARAREEAARHGGQARALTARPPSRRANAALTPLQPARREDRSPARARSTPCHAETSRPIPTSRSARPSTSRKASARKAVPGKTPSASPGPPSTSRTAAARSPAAGASTASTSRRGDMAGYASAFRRGSPAMRPALLAFALALAVAAPAVAQDAKDTPKPKSAQDIIDAAPASAWRTRDPANTLYMELPAGRVVIELAPGFAPGHVANIKAMAKGGFWDGLDIYRSQDNFV